ncbi:hypothetical protein Psi02_17170 [Planotetraspora silvatica]|uniref:Uncharacterized protein n=1 Tax=Planotetraspora silvatica TaxID=234614 RepID=A0A8J3UHB1_9ACTN|nr:hypothetical protein [Planotetraspora silvatica]GII45293.1 hypothetical protein Psi02_17170 [Planotetraspora silvatica]
MTVRLEHGQRQFHVMAYRDAIYDDAWAIELAELVDQELGPALVTVLYPSDGICTDPQVLLKDSSLPLPILTSFIDEVAREERRIREEPEPRG